jgi:DNA helicase II / ATP-dependent DNA helicase PcrA
MEILRTTPPLQELFEQFRFSPNDEQYDAIRNVDSSLFLVAGPGSGKTRVLLWRTVNAIVYHGYAPEEIFLSTFTEKAAKQLIEGIQSILNVVTTFNDKHYDISKMYVGTVHSLCQRMLMDRKLRQDFKRLKPPILLDEIDQFFYINSTKRWQSLEEVIGLSFKDLSKVIHTLEYPNGRINPSGYGKAYTTNILIKHLNRMSEESISPDQLISYAQKQKSESLKLLAKVYHWYESQTITDNVVDFSLLQRRAYQFLQENPLATSRFKMVVIDEYQDSNSIQEKIFFELAKVHRNICVVGDDDQSLYRFRGATVSNFVNFPTRCQEQLYVKPITIPLNTNYRSNTEIVHFYKNFINQENWADGQIKYRVEKDIRPFKQNKISSVFVTKENTSKHVADEIVSFVHNLIDSKKVEDPSQIAFLFPSLTNTHVKNMKNALEVSGLQVYAPRAGSFLNTEEAKLVFGLIGHVIGFPTTYARDFQNWMDTIAEETEELMGENEQLASFVRGKQLEIKFSLNDYHFLLFKLQEAGISLTDPYNPDDSFAIGLVKIPDLNKETIRNLKSKNLSIRARQKYQESLLDSSTKPYTYNYVLNRVTALNWSLLDLFYRLCGFDEFRDMFRKAALPAGGGLDEEPIINLAKISDYLAKYIEKSVPIISGSMLDNQKMSMNFFNRYLYGLFILKESEVENTEDILPRGRIPFLTIHQSKGLEFPYVVVGRLGSYEFPSKPMDYAVNILSDSSQEPFDKIRSFDEMRKFYVALSRAENAVILANVRSDQWIKKNKALDAVIDAGLARPLSTFETSNFESIDVKEEIIPKSYSYTSDFQFYSDCPRKYMAFRKYNFVPSRTQTMLFGSLVHNTIEDLHNFIISRRKDGLN